MQEVLLSAGRGEEMLEMEMIWMDVFTVTKRCSTKTGVVKKNVLHYNHSVPVVKKYQ